MSDPLFKVNDRVIRDETRDPPAEERATVITVSDEEDFILGWNYEISYDEGGSGWWPESSLLPLTE